MADAFLAFRARLQPRATALITPGVRRSYAELDADVNRYARALAERGLGPASGLAAVAGASYDRGLVLALALSRLGVGTTIAADTRADVRLVLGPKRLDPRPGDLALDEAWIAATEGAPPVPLPSAARDPDTVGRVQFTSGSTGTPRRVGRTWRMLEARAHEAAALFAGGRGGTWILRTPFETGLGQALASAAWMTGAAVATAFECEHIPPLIEAHPPGLLAITPIQLRELLGFLPPGFRPEPRLKVLVTGGALPPATARQTRLRLTPDVDIVYGSSETGRVAVGPASRLEAEPGWVGWPVPGVRVEVLGPDGLALPPGQTGEIRIAGLASAARYLDEDEHAARVFRDGFVHPGDLGRLTADGGLVLEGRLDERMNIGGVKVAPHAVEDAALEHPQVRDAAAFALPDVQGMDVCWLAVVVEGDLPREELAAHLQAHGPRLPAVRFAWAEAIPRTESGKVDRAALKAQALAALSTPPA